MSKGDRKPPGFGGMIEKRDTRTMKEGQTCRVKAHQEGTRFFVRPEWASDISADWTFSSVSQPGKKKDWRVGVRLREESATGKAKLFMGIKSLGKGSGKGAHGNNQSNERRKVTKS